MDGGEKQRDIALGISRQIKQRALGRRQKHWGGLGGGGRGGGGGTTSFIITPIRSGSTSSSRDFEAGNAQDVTSAAIPPEPAFPFSPETTPAAVSPSVVPRPTTTITTPHADTMASFGDVPSEHLIMGYLDYCFPFIFPFYQPPFLSSGRGWLLYLLKNNNAVYQSAVSLTSYFLTVVVNEALPGKYERCKKRLWDRVIDTADNCYGMIQQDLTNLSITGAGVPGKARAMAAITQLLVFDLFIGRATNWQIHLRPAISLLYDIMRECLDDDTSGGSSGGRGLGSILDRLKTPVSIQEYTQWPGLSNDQAAFRFFVAILVYVDIVAATALGSTAQLRTFHIKILKEEELFDLSPSLFLGLSKYIGCENWAMMAVSDITALSSWKREAVGQGSLSVPELVERAGQISNILDKGFKDLEGRRRNASEAETNRIRRLRKFNFQAPRLSNGDIQEHIPTYIWAYAARIYLTVVVSGWQPSNPSIKDSVRAVLELLKILQQRDAEGGATQMRALAWPICVAGCLAENNEVATNFREVIADTMGEMCKLGSISEAIQIMEAVWKVKRTGEPTGLGINDIQGCLEILGSPALLV